MMLKSNSKRKSGRKLEELLLPGSRLKFSSQQLQNLNLVFEKRLLEPLCTKEIESNIILARSVTERLIQRLVCGAGTIDEKFSSKYLIHLHSSDERTTNLRYLVRLDKLSRPSLYKDDSLPKYSIIEDDPDFPKGYARIRMFSSLYKLWGDYANANGYLRRDKIQSRYVSLLARAASSDLPNSPAYLDEAILCASPGKVVDPSTLQRILKIPTERHVYYGSNGNAPRFPDPRDFRLAIVDEPTGIRIRIEFLSPALSSLAMDVTILIGIEADSWPVSSDFPTRISLGHSDSLLYQLTAQTGLYLVGFGVQSSAWQMRVPAAEETILKNYSPNSTIHSILKLLKITLDEIYEESSRHQKYQLAYKILNGYILKTALFYELEKDLDGPTVTLLNWSPKSLSTHVLKIFDNIISSLRNQKLSNYFFPATNLIGNPGHLCEDDYIYESKRILIHLVKLQDMSLTHIAERSISLAQELESSLLHKWKELIDGLLPPASTRGRRFCLIGKTKRVAYTQYTGRQLEYIALILKNALIAKKSILKPLDETWEGYPPDTKKDDLNTTEDLVYIILIIIEQAKDHFLKVNTNEKFKLKLKLHFDSTIMKLVDLIRRSDETILDDLDFVKVTLKWLYRVLDQNKRLLSPILRPYLNTLFISSHGNSWFLESFKERTRGDEIVSLGIFSELVNKEKITPAEGLIESINKRWSWAKDMLTLVERQRLRVVFVEGRGKIGRHLMSVPNDFKAKAIAEDESYNLNTLPKKSYFCTLLKNDLESSQMRIPWHCILRDNSPLTKMFNKQHRFGDHRCGGDIVETLMSMQKLNLLQDVSSILPQEDRLQLLEVVQKLSRKNGNPRRRAQTLPNYSKQDNNQKYTRKEESAGIRTSKEGFVLKTLQLDPSSLIQSCRDVRMKDDGSYDRKVRIVHRQSFKY
ncbi:PREDICTED: uncharacterized protein LOC108563814 [Nicrophorus vespilloides]|uniref:Uncharacterized protein LOC108563814 n=1 Tax=Nicrophorus vespilloides TaxID=110193 RepID=A0ABM1MU46_NICVS|nr:PREDICTED: uncharacterized protein LOC108563814 [Nicrophorus vespilloides]XP_017778102.1 PREDICTED: uncharacterized protein LOC108563814 [Nicrophorus vespilloides]XP_017778110.1 PREDICTED: uncharacterized protein LOC108563814 [Nicrophorus vespilloides]